MEKITKLTPEQKALADTLCRMLVDDAPGGDWKSPMWRSANEYAAMVFSDRIKRNYYPAILVSSPKAHSDAVRLMKAKDARALRNAWLAEHG